MKRAAAAYLAALVLLTPAAAPGLDQASADALARYLLGQLGRPGGGIVSLPAAGDGMLARSVLQSSRMWVHAMAPSDAGAQAVRALLETTGQVGSRAWVEKGTAAALPYADNLVDMVVVANLTDASLTGVSITEVQRCLNPAGRAFIGRATAEGAGITTGALTSWVDGRSGWSVATDSQGTWAIYTRPWPANRDEWTHTMHGPDNNPVSSDSSIKWPYLPQWRQKPYAASRAGGIVTSSGRAYMAINIRSAGHAKELVLFAYRIHNGCCLWSTVLDPRSSQTGIQQNVAPTGASFMVACPEGVWVEQRNRAALLGGETGTALRTITFDASTARWVKWMALSGGLLYGLVGDSTQFDRTWTGVPGAYDSAFYRYGNVVAAFDAATGQERWRKTLGARIDSRDIGIADGKLFYYARGQRVGCLNAASGDSLWSQTDASILSQLEDNSRGGTSWTTYPTSGFLCSSYGIFACDPDDIPMVALSAADGHLLWTASFAGWERMMPHLILGATLVNPMASPSDRRFVDITTGLATTQYSTLAFGGNCCGVRTASPDGFFANFGGQACSFSLNRNITTQHYKTDCGIGTILSDGMFLSAPTGCQCEPVRGMVANAGAGAFEFGQSAVQAERLEAGPAMGNVVAQVQPDALDWWTRRGSAGHSAYAAVNVPSSPHLVCQYSPAAPYDSTWSASSSEGLDDRPDSRPTPPAVVGNLVFWGGTDGYLRCFSISTGTAVWSYATAGAIRATPTVWNGCVYAGSEDGWAYCLEAHTGRLVWRFRAAPVERRVNLYGHLGSTWPVNSGVAISGSSVVLAAGGADNFGTHVYALDARSGSIVWQNNSSGGAYNAQDRIGVVPCGFGAMVRGAYWLRSAVGRAGIYAAGTGALLPLPSAVSGNMWGGPRTYGAEIGLLDSTHAIFGGRLPDCDQADRVYSDRKRTLVIQQADAQGNAVYPEVALTLNSLHAAWDDQAYVTQIQNGHSSSWIERWSTADCIRIADSIRQANAGATEVCLDWPGFVSTTPTRLAQWSIPNIAPNAIALARNAVVVLSASWVGNERYDQWLWKWNLCLLARDNVDTLWSTRLPCEPVQGGVAISRNGDIIVALRSGAILCYGAGTVGVAAVAPVMTAPARASAPAAAAAWAPAATRPAALADESAPTAPVAGLAAVRPAHRLELALAEPSAAQSPTAADFAAACRLSPEYHAVSHAEKPATARSRTDMAWRPGRACLPVISVSATSSARGTRAAGTIDRDLTTRWTPSATGPQSITYDLGTAREVAAVTIVWYAPRQSQAPYAIAVSLDGERFSPVDEGALSGRGTNSTLRSFLPAQARYVRVTLGAPVSVYEVGIHAAAGEAVAGAR